MIEGGDVIVTLGERVLGRVVAQDVLDPSGKETLIEAGTLIDETWVYRLENDEKYSGIDNSGALRDHATRLASVPTAMAVTWVVDIWLTEAKRSVLLPPSPSVNRVPVDHAYLPHRWCCIASRCCG